VWVGVPLLGTGDEVAEAGWVQRARCWRRGENEVQDRDGGVWVCEEVGKWTCHGVVLTALVLACRTSSWRKDGVENRERERRDDVCSFERERLLLGIYEVNLARGI